MKALYSVLGSLVLTGFTACGESVMPDPQPGQAQVDERLVNAYTSFGLELFDTIVRTEGGSNVFTSPSSVAFALAMTYHGAAGETQDAIAGILKIGAMSPEVVARANEAWRISLAGAEAEVELAIANSIWAREGVPFKAGFLALNREFYDAEVATLDFSRADASATINDWVEGSTNGKIEEIVPARIDPLTVMYLINAIYFKGLWTEPFDPDRTSDGDFTLPDGTLERVPMMSRRGDYGMLDGDGFRAIRLPYGEGRMAMYIFLPDEDSDLDAWYDGLNTETWEQWMTGFREQDVMLTLPRFRVEYERTLKETLSAMGMEVAFEPTRANFEGMLPREFLDANNAYISEVKHKTFVEVTEEGTEAAAATSVEIGIVSMPPRFIVNRPFFAAIRDDETGTILFLGQIADPA